MYRQLSTNPSNLLHTLWQDIPTLPSRLVKDLERIRSVLMSDELVLSASVCYQLVISSNTHL